MRAHKMVRIFVAPNAKATGIPSAIKKNNSENITKKGNISVRSFLEKPKGISKNLNLQRNP
jgi:hypothetical protein